MRHFKGMICLIGFGLFALGTIANAQVVDSLVEGPSVQVSQDQTVPVTVSCPTGYKVVSGGWEASGGSNQLFVPRSLPSNSTLNEWDFNFRNNGASTTTVNTFIIVRLASPDSLVEGPSVQVSQDQTVPVTVSCPNGYTVVSGGWEASGGSNQLFVPRSLPSNSTLNEWDFNFRNNGASTTTVNTFIIVRRVTITAIEDFLGEIPIQYSLSQNYPNPFNPTTTIIYQLPKTSKVSLTIYNIIGQKIKALINETQSAGKHTVTWDGLDQNGQNVSSGIYLYRLQTYDFIKTYKMLVVR